MTRNHRHIILFDGVCNLCNSSVQLIIKLDKKKVFRFASLQSEAGKNLLQQAGLPSNHFDSFVYLKGEQYYFKSDAMLHVARTLGGFWSLAHVFTLLPRKLKERVYERIARNRYRWFGKKEECMVPTSELKERFL